jgi:agarase
METRWKLLLLALVCASPLAASRVQDVPGAAPRGFFRTEKRQGRWWLIDPDGKPFLSKGVASVQYGGDRIRDTTRAPYGETTQANYGSREKWRAATAERLVRWGFNTVGAWSDDGFAKIEVDGRHLACMPVLNLGEKYVSERMNGRAWLEGIFPDVFDPEFAVMSKQIAQKQCAPRKNEPWLIGWFTDNELRWGPDWRGEGELLELFLDLSESAPGRQAAVALLRDRYSDVAKFDDVWGTKFASWEELEAASVVRGSVAVRRKYLQNSAAPKKSSSIDRRRVAFAADCDAFLVRVAELYFKITEDAIKEADPNHMVFGCRFAYLPAPPVVAAASQHVAVVSFNAYGKDPRWLIGQYSAFGKPLLIGEFSFRGRDSGLPNKKGSGPLLQNQVDRAIGFEQYVFFALGQPDVVGYHWFQYVDEPREGRPDGEDSNYGVVNVKDEPYETLTRKMAIVNAKADEFHGR